MSEFSDRIAGYISAVIYENEASGYKVLEVESEDGLELITAVGILPDVEVGEKITASGKWDQHSTYGEQFSIREYERSVPDDIQSMERYLGSGVIKGVGEALARKIVEKFGEDTFRIIDTEPERLASIKGIGDRKAIEIGEQFAQKAASREAMVYLESLGLTPTMSMKVYKSLGDKTIRTVRTNPYILAEKVAGISFKKADEIAMRAGLPLDSPSRIAAAIRYVLLEATYEGHTFLPRHVLEEEIYRQIEIGGSLFDTAVDACMMSGAIILMEDNGEENVYLRPYYTAETYTANRLSEMSYLGREVPEVDLSARLRKICGKMKIELSDEQKQAVESAYRQSVVIITGGPGTGKTTIIRALIALLEEDGAKFALCAPTGKAAKRMEEAAGKEGRTIHRLLEVASTGEEGVGHMEFNRNEEHPLEYDYLIADEMSMVDISLMSHFLKAIPSGTHLVMLGDKDQLPSVGAGNVLRDMIESGVVEVNKLTHIYRQTGESDIVSNAHRINEGDYPVFDNKHSDFFLMRENNADSALKTLVETVKTRFPRFYRCDPIEDIQVLSPMKKGTLGVKNLNQALQQALNPPAKGKKELSLGEVRFREGDKVMQIRNNYEMPWKVMNRYNLAIDEGKGVFNGDTGRIFRISAEGIEVKFDGLRHVVYDQTDLAQLELAYAITIHKSQGTESPVVVMPLLEGPDVLMTRNLLYTGITRARKYVVLIGREDTIRRMVDHNQQAIRYSMLAKRLGEAAERFADN